MFGPNVPGFPVSEVFGQEELWPLNCEHILVPQLYEVNKEYVEKKDPRVWRAWVAAVTSTMTLLTKIYGT